MNNNNKLINIPNLLSILRLLCAPLLVLAATAPNSVPFFMILSLMLLSDMLDGFLARRLNQTSLLGARLDSYGDYATYLAVAVGAWLLWPERIEREAPVIFFIMVVFVLPAVASLIKFRRFASYHTRLTKFAAVLISFGIFSLLLFNLSWPLYIAAAVLVMEAVENIAITLLLNEPRTDIASYWMLRKTVHEEDASSTVDDIHA